MALILGGIYLIATKTISAAIPLSYIGTVAVLSLVLGQDVVLQLFSGGLLLGAFFMATDYVTSPFTFTGRIVYGVCLGVILHHPVLRQHGRRCQLCVAADEPAGALYQ